MTGLSDGARLFFEQRDKVNALQTQLSNLNLSIQTSENTKINLETQCETDDERRVEAQEQLERAKQIRQNAKSKREEERKRLRAEEEGLVGGELQHTREDLKEIQRKRRGLENGEDRAKRSKSIKKKKAEIDVAEGRALLLKNAIGTDEEKVMEGQGRTNALEREVEDLVRMIRKEKINLRGLQKRRQMKSDALRYRAVAEELQKGAGNAYGELETMYKDRKLSKKEMAQIIEEMREFGVDPGLSLEEDEEKYRELRSYLAELNERAGSLDFSDLERKIEELGDKIKDRQKKIQDLQKQYEALRAKLEVANRQIAQTSRRIAANQERLDPLLEKIEALRNNLQDSKDKRHGHDGALEQLQANESRLGKLLSELQEEAKGRIDRKKAKVDSAWANERTARRQLRDAEDAVKLAGHELKKKRAELGKVVEDGRVLDTRREDLRRLLAKERRKLAKLLQNIVQELRPLDKYTR